MIPHPKDIDLPYRLTATFREREALDGRFPEPIQSASFPVDELPLEHAERILAVYSQLAWLPGPGRSPLVHDTGVDLAAVETGPDTTERLVDDIYREIGDLPPLDGWASEVGGELLDAYERWIDRYRGAAVRALKQWVHRWAQDEPLTADAVRMGMRPDFWRVGIQVRVQPDGAVERFFVDGRTDFDLFRRARAAVIRRMVAKTQVNPESWAKAEEIVEPLVWVQTLAVGLSTVVDSLEHVTRRLTEVALAHHHQKTIADRQFADDMRRWAEARGSGQLRMGIADGYRMTSVYLNERLAKEAPGCYAFRLQAKRMIGKERAGPSELALLLRRAIQARLDTATASRDRQYVAVIRWVSIDDLPAALVEVVEADEPQELEAVVVADWLGRYQLVGLVEPPVRAPYWVKSWLDPAAYGLRQASPAIDDDIPF